MRFLKRPLSNRLRVVALAFGIFVLWSTPAALAQLTSTQSGAGPSRPQQVPLSGRNDPSGSVSVAEQPNGSAASSVNTLSSSLQVGGAYAGSSSGSSEPALTNRRLSISEAIRRGLLHNLGAQAAGRAEQQTLASQNLIRSVLLPNVNVQLSENVDKVNLATSGFDAASFPSIGQYFPSAVGPFHYYSAQANVSDSVLDVVAIRNYATSKSQTEASRMGYADARERVVLAVTGSYLNVLSQIALLASDQSQVMYSRSIYNRSVAEEQAGTKAQVDVNRNSVQVQTEEQRLLADDAALTKRKMMLAREIGLSIDEDFDVEENLSSNTEPPIDLAEAYRRALGGRSDLRAAEAQLRAAEDARKAAGAERLPSLKLQGFYGVQGVNPNTGTTVYNGSAQINLPVFNGGQIRSDEKQADAARDQRKSELDDMREQVRFDVRSAWIDQDVAGKQVLLAESNRTLAAETLRQSNDRFFGGAATSVEVVQSEQAVASAERDYIEGLFSLNLAKINLARAMGEAEKDIPSLLKGRD